MKFVIDMNLSPEWCAEFSRRGHGAVHWSGVGDPAAPDRDILEWAAREGRVVFTNDLDFGAILASTGGRAPSVIQVRSQALMPAAIGAVVAAAIEQFGPELTRGSLVTIDAASARARVLPVRR